MKRLILDHIRRKAWFLAFWAVNLTFVEVLGIESGLPSGINAHKYASSDLIPYVPIQTALFMGAVLLSYDLQRGIGRALASLPLTVEQIGRAWWLATVAIPSILLAVLLFLSVGITHLFRTGVDFPLGSLAMTSVLTLFWLGGGFYVIFKIRSGLQGNWWQRVGGLWGLMSLCGCLLLLQRGGEASTKIAVLCGLGAPMTAAGWFRAGRLVSGCASPLRSALPSGKAPGRHRTSGGYGGIPLLIGTTFTRGFLGGLAIIGVLAAAQALDPHVISSQQGGEVMSFTLLYPFIFVRSILPELRFLRTLPISATYLAAVMIAIVILPLLALGAVIAGVTGLMAGTSDALAFSTVFVLMLAPVAMGVFVAVWRGIGIYAFGLLILTMLGSQVAFDYLGAFSRAREIPFIATGAITGIFVTLAFLFTRRAITQSSETYRVRAYLLGRGGWSIGR